MIECTVCTCDLGVNCETNIDDCTGTNCIVLYLYIYIALLAVHTNQKRFQCERPREKIYLYLRELCCPLLSAMSSRSLRSSQQGLLLVPFARTSAKQSRDFSVV